VQQRDADGAVLVDLGHQDDGAVVAAALGDDALLLHRDEVLGALQHRVLFEVRERSCVAMPRWSMTWIWAVPPSRSPSMR
jgi:hypothetical protein